MGRYDIRAVETGEDDQDTDTDSRRHAGGQADQPKRTPIRRKDKWRQEEGIKAKTKRSHKKIQHRLKYDWKEE
jgi:hypothetical protein